VEDQDWLLMLNRDGVVEAVDGGAPQRWLYRRIDACAELPEAVRAEARRLVRELAQPRAGTLVRRARVRPERPGAPSFTLLTVEAIVLRPAEVDLEPFLRRALAPLSTQAERAAVALDVEIAPDVPARASLDGAKIAWAVTALVGNALRYVRHGGPRLPGGHIGVRLGHSAAQGMLSLTVEDDGPGMPANVQSRLLSSGAEGDATGVSLQLVHEVVAAHGGGMVIKSSSSPEDRGTTVTLWLPARSESRAA
jgi:signal transduction histidine kinase